MAGFASLCFLTCHVLEGPAVREKSVYALAGALLLAVWAAAPLAGTGATFVTVEWLCPLCALIRVGLTLAGFSCKSNKKGTSI